jgi:hypothetical protein
LFITSCIISPMILSFSMMVSSSRLDPGIKSGRTKAYHVTTSGTNSYLLQALTPLNIY